MKLLFYISIFILSFSSCRKIEIVVPSEYELIGDGIQPDADPVGMYLVNEGNMGSNKCTLDYLDFVNGYYIRNLYSERNPDVVKELGDVGNDIQIYGSKLYVVVNCSIKWRFWMQKPEFGYPKWISQIAGTSVFIGEKLM